MDEGRAFPLAPTDNAAWPETRPDHTRRAAGGRGIVATIAAGDRLAQSRILARSARECHPDTRLAVLAPAAGRAPQTLVDLYDVVLSADELSLNCLADMRFRFTTEELCFALKPWFLRHLLEQFAGEPVYYFDPDIEIFSPLAEAEAALAQGANLVLTPHILRPGPDDGSERALLRSGSFNAGFVAVAPSAEARAFVAWWCEKVRTGWTDEHSPASHGDQKWLELAPSICDGVVVLRHPGYNFGYWNGHERPLSCLGGNWTAAGSPLRFVHYSGWNTHSEDAEEYLARYFRSDNQAFSGLFAEYRKKVREEDGDNHAQPSAPVYSEVLSPAGEPVPDLVRQAYGRHSPAIDGGVIEVFGRAVAVLNAPSTARNDIPGLPIGVLYDEIWQRDDNLRDRFDIDRKSGRLAYLQWLVDRGLAELQIPVAFRAEARSVLERERLRQLESDDAAVIVAPVAAAAPVLPELPASADALGVLIAARDAAQEYVRRQADDIRLLVRSNKALRREVTGLRVRRWRDDETIATLESELLPTRRARDRARRRSQQLVEEVAALRLPVWRIFAGWGRSPHPADDRASGRRSMLIGDGPFFTRGFRLGDAAEVVDATVKRAPGAPGGFLVFGPYIQLPAGSYAVTLDARLYRHLPVVAAFKLDIVSDGAQQVVAMRRFRLHSLAGWRRFELVFTVWDDLDHPDFEIRVWAGKGTPLEIGGLDLSRLSEGLVNE